MAYAICEIDHKILSVYAGCEVWGISGEMCMLDARFGVYRGKCVCWMRGLGYIGGNIPGYILYFTFCQIFLFIIDDEGTIKDAFLQLKETSFEDACREYQHRCLFLLLGVRPAVTGNFYSVIYSQAGLMLWEH